MKATVSVCDENCLFEGACARSMLRSVERGYGAFGAISGGWQRRSRGERERRSGLLPLYRSATFDCAANASLCPSKTWF